MAAPDLAIPSRDGTPIALFRSGDPDMAPVILVHGSTADHTTFRVVGPLLTDRFAVYAMDRRGRGASGVTRVLPRLPASATIRPASRRGCARRSQRQYRRGQAVRHCPSGGYSATLVA